ncbi:DsbC family protein [Geobacter sp. DSM 9736]|uniref:DsbC family protein n=1 Tax=Geobacter sp. DSM 9736 TaxID=1277350 RepID=UPI000B5132AB|nr:DsbC family protein [Geobacter sp. DSM 9736]SNB46200.1 thiol:disulfide interchange protein DsbC [Geobacter sp. DSM 9736]
MPKFFILLLVLFVPVMASAVPHEQCGDGKKECGACHTLSLPEANSILKGVGEVKVVKPAPISGLFELTLESKGQQGVAYLDFSKKHLIAGPIFDVTTKNIVGTKPQPAKPATVNPSTIPLTDSVLMGNPEGTKKLFVFTDPDCPFCAKLHRELVKLMYMGPDLAIYIKLFPLKMHPEAYDKARTILSGENPLYLLDQAFSGEKLPAPKGKEGAEAVDSTIKFAESIGVTATPTLILSDGRIMPGYKEAAEIKKLLTVSPQEQVK